MSRRSGLWAVLGIDRTDDPKTIRKAYADKLRGMDIDREAANYAVLRDARDGALRLAKAHAASTPSDDEWRISRSGPKEGGAEAGKAAPPIEDHGSALEVETNSSPVPPAQSEEEQANLPDRRLDRLLFPGGEVSDQPFTHEEGNEAHRAMRELIADIVGGDVTRQRYGDNWLADRLAHAWPRSAPLLADAAEAFDWEKSRGQLGEGSAQAFLNARLRGLRFYDAVQQPGNWAHKAWKELSTPGEKGLFGSFRARKSDVDKLLKGIRENFPEVESYLDPRKVATWEPAPGGDWNVPRGVIFVGLLVAFQLLRLCTAALPDSGQIPYPDPIERSTSGWTTAERDRLATELVGSGTPYATIITVAPDLDTYFSSQSFAGASHQDVRNRMIAYVRSIILRADDRAEFEAVLRIKQLQLDYMDLALQKSGPAGCIEVMDSAQLPLGIAVPAEMRERERALALELLDRGLLRVSVRQSPGDVSIPQQTFERAERASGVTGKAAQQAAMDKGEIGNRCRFRKALLAEMLRRPGKVSAEALRLI